MAQTIKQILAGQPASDPKASTSLGGGLLRGLFQGLTQPANQGPSSIPINFPQSLSLDSKPSSILNYSSVINEHPVRSPQLNLRDLKPVKLTGGNIVRSLDEIHSGIVSYLNTINKNVGLTFGFVKDVSKRFESKFENIQKDNFVIRKTQEDLSKQLYVVNARLMNLENRKSSIGSDESSSSSSSLKNNQSNSGTGILSTTTAVGVGAAAGAVATGAGATTLRALRAVRRGGLAGIATTAAEILLSKNPYANRVGSEKKITDEEWDAIETQEEKNSIWKWFNENDAYKKGEDKSIIDNLKHQLQLEQYGPSKPKEYKSIRDHLKHKLQMEEYGPFKPEEPQNEDESDSPSAQGDEGWLEKRQKQLQDRKKNILDKRSELTKEGDQTSLPMWAQFGLAKGGEWGAWGATQGTKLAGVVNPAAWSMTAIGVHEFVKRGITDEVKSQFEKTGKLEIPKGSLGDMYGAFSWMEGRNKKKDEDADGGTVQKMSYQPEQSQILDKLHIRKSDITLEALSDIHIVALKEIVQKSRRIIIDSDIIEFDSPNIIFTSKPNIKGGESFGQSKEQGPGQRPGQRTTPEDNKVGQTESPITLPGEGSAQSDPNFNQRLVDKFQRRTPTAEQKDLGTETSPSPQDDILGGMSRTLPPLPQGPRSSSGRSDDRSTSPGSSDSSSFLSQKRSQFAEELKNPNTRKLLGAIISAENPGAGPAVVESLMNRTELVNAAREKKGLPPLTLYDMMVGHSSIGGGKSFYGPIRSGAIDSHLQKMNNPDFAASMDKRIDQALSGSDTIKGHTDQGSRGDPNYEKGGVGVNINGERFNDWGHQGAASWRQQRQQEQGSSENVSEKQSGIRNQPISSTLKSQLDFAAAKTGLKVEVYSGGQSSSGPNRTGSHRHDDGGAADLKLRDLTTGRILDSSNPEDQKRMREFTEHAVRAGATGVGHGSGYMGTESLHIGGGTPASWGGAPWIESARQAGMKDRLTPQQLSDELGKLKPKPTDPIVKAASFFPVVGFGDEASKKNDPTIQSTPQETQSFQGVAAQNDSEWAAKYANRMGGRKRAEEYGPPNPVYQGNMGNIPIGGTAPGLEPPPERNPEAGGFYGASTDNYKMIIPKTSHNPEKEDGSPARPSGLGGTESDPDNLEI